MQPLQSVRSSSLVLRALPFAVALAAAMPVAQAQAQGCVGAPGASALEQYCEAVPRADGGRERPDSGGGSGGSSNGSNGTGSGSGSGVSSRTSEQLNEAGADGAAVERLAGGGASSSEGSGAKKKSSKSGSSETADASAVTDSGAVKGERVEGPADPSGSPLKAATNAVQSGPTAGGALVWGLVGISALGAVGAVFMRRQKGFGPGPDDTQN